MKKLSYLLSLILLFSISGCFNSDVKQEVITDENFVELVELLETPIMANEKLKYISYNGNRILENIISSNTFNKYALSLVNNYSYFSSVIDSNIITKLDMKTNTTTTFKENVNIASLDHFSEMILDSYSEEFSYYSFKDFIPLTLELTKLNVFEYSLDNTTFEEKQYRLSGMINISKIDDNLADILDSLLIDYKTISTNDLLNITITFRTNNDNTYFKPEFNLNINNNEIINIT